MYLCQNKFLRTYCGISIILDIPQLFLCDPFPVYNLINIRSLSGYIIKTIWDDKIQFISRKVHLLLTYGLG